MGGCVSFFSIRHEAIAMVRRAYSIALPYLAAVVSVTASSLLPVLFPGLDTRYLVLVYFGSVVFSAWYGGLGPALLATASTYLVANLFFIPLKYRFVFDAGTVTFLVACLSIAALSEAMRRAKRRAAASAERVVSIVESLGEGFLAVDKHGRCTYMNRAAEELSQLDRQDAHGRRPEEVFPLIADTPAKAQLHRAAIERIKAEFETFYEPWKQWLEVKASPTDEGSLAIFFRDVTERKIAEIGLAKSEERLRFAQRGARAGLWDRDLISGQVAWSDEYYQVNGIPTGTLPSIEALLDIVHPDDRSMVSDAIRGVHDNGADVNIEYRTLHPTEGIRWIAARGQATLDAEGRPIRSSGIVLDVTERKKAEESLRLLSEAGTVLSVLVDFESSIQRVAGLAVRHLADWCVVDMVTPLGQVERMAFAHREAQQCATLSELLDRYPLDWASPASQWQVLRTKAPVLISQISAGALAEAARDATHLRLLEALHPSSIIMVPLVVRDRAVGTLTFVSADEHQRYGEEELELATELARRVAIASDNARLYAELSEAQRQKDDFLAMLAHELRNPLAAIQYANQVTKLTETEANPVSDVIDRQVKNLAHLIDDLLDVSRITRDKVQLRKENVDGRLLLERAVATVRPDIDARRHTLSVKIDPAPLPLWADPVRVEQILVNLLSNAAKYTPEGGQISVRSFSTDGLAVFKVCDSGIGIPLDMLPRVFELFTQVDRSLDRSQGGLGIGLTVVRKLAEMHGGSVSVASGGLGRGSEFTVRLPLTEELSPPATSSPEPAPAAMFKILVVDDNVDMAKGIAQLLEALGHEITVAHDGPSALELARRHEPHVILLDIGLPGLDGYRVAEALRREPAFAKVKLIAVSGYGQAEDQKRAHDAGFDLHLVKPVDFGTLVTAIGPR